MAGVEDGQRSWEADYYLPVILLRLYEQAPIGSVVREYSLDAWDLLLRNRVLHVASLTKQVTAE
jgi:hypothetical protein